MGWPFDEASWNAVEGAYYAAQGTEFLWVLISVGMCVVACVIGSKHELDAYKRAKDNGSS